MHATDSPFSFEMGRQKLFLEAKYLVEDQFPNVSDEHKAALIGQLVSAYCTLHAAQKIADEISGGRNSIAEAIREQEVN
jgi:hypothetical protein